MMFLYNNVVPLFCSVPADFGVDPISGHPIDITQRPEIRSPMVEFIAPQEYMVSCMSYFNQQMYILLFCCVFMYIAFSYNVLHSHALGACATTCRSRISN